MLLPTAAMAMVPQTLDEELLKEPAARAPDADLSTQLERELGPAAQSEDDWPLVAIAQRMREAKGRIVGKDAGPATQGLQRQIVADLDALIRQACKRCEQANSANCQSPTPGQGAGQPKAQPVTGRTSPGQAPATTNNATQGKQTDGRAALRTLEDVRRKFWGMLPPREREQMMQSPGAEEFLPKYETLIEEYFRRLSEEGTGEGRSMRDE